VKLLFKAMFSKFIMSSSFSMFEIPVELFLDFLSLFKGLKVFIIFVDFEKPT